MSLHITMTGQIDRNKDIRHKYIYIYIYNIVIGHYDGYDIIDMYGIIDIYGIIIHYV